ncbi:PAS domain S-box protein [bacterium]|nr:PAS domain S-box protein [bacterium]
MRKRAHENPVDTMADSPKKARNHAVETIWNIYSRSSIPALIAGEDGRIEEYNDAMAELTGYSRSEVPDMSAWISALSGDQTTETGDGGLFEEFQCGRIRNSSKTCAITLKNGEKRHVELLSYDIMPERKSSDLYVVQVFDISGREKNRLKTTGREDEFKTLVEHSPDIIARYDRDFRCVYINSPIEKATGVPSHAFIGKTHRELGMSEDLYTELEKYKDRVIKNGREVMVEFDYPTPDGLRHYQAHVFPELGRDGSIEFLVSITRDITDLKQAEEALKKHREHLEETISERTLELKTTNERLHREINDRIHAEEALRENEERYRNIFNTIPISIWEYDLENAITYYNNNLKNQGISDFNTYIDEHPDVLIELVSQVKVIDVNDMTLKLYGAGNKGEMISQFGKRLLPQTITLFREIIVAFLNGETFFEGETVNETLDGRKITINFRATYLSKNQKFPRALTTVIDITEQKRRETERLVLQQVREEVLKMRGVEDIQRVMEVLRQTLPLTEIPYHEAGINIIVRSEEPAVVRGYALTKEENINDLSSEVSRNIILGFWKTGKPVYRHDLAAEDPYNEYELLYEIWGWPVLSVIDIPFSHGTLAFNSNRPNAFSPDDIRFFQEVALVLSEGFHRAEDLQQVAHSEERYRTLVESPTDQVVMLRNPEGGCIYVSPQIQAFTGYSPEEFRTCPNIGKAIIHPDDYKEIRKSYIPALSGVTVKNQEYRLKKSDGGYLWVSHTVSPIFNKDGNIEAIQIVTHDISERKQAEEALRSSETRYKRLLESVTDYVYTVYIENGRPISTYHGPGCIAVTGYTSEEYAGDQYLWYRMVYDEDRSTVIEQAERIISGKSMSELEHRIYHKDGSVRWVRNTPVPRYDDQGYLVSYDGLITDITDRKRAEEALQESERRFRTLVTHAPVGIFQADLFGDCLFVNEKWCEITGLSREEAAGKGWIKALHPDDREFITKEWYNSARSRKEFAFEYRFMTSEGKTSWVFGTAAAIQNETGETIGYLRTMTDITERKQMEEALKESENRFSVFMDHTPELVFMKDQDNKLIYVNKTMRDMYKNMGLIQISLQALFPETEYLFVNNDKNVLNGGPLEIIETVHDKNLVPRTFRVFKFPIIREGKHTLLGGIAEDITEKIKVQDALRKSEEKFRALVEHSSDIIVRFDEKYRYLYVNPAMAKISGIDPEMCIGKTSREIGFPADISIFWEKKIKDVFKKKHPVNEQYELETAQGTIVYDWRLVPESGTGGKIESVLSTSRDITERKKAEEQIKKSLEEKEVLLKEIHHRVKNNMQVISSLLTLQSERIKNKRYLTMIHESINRIQTMALIHTMLYQSETLTHINFNDYIGKMILNIISLYSSTCSRVEVRREIHDIYFSIDKAIPCGLIINELVSNSFKHAFPHNKRGTITIEMKDTGDSGIMLKIIDDGIGISPEIDWRKTDSLGLKIVSLLVERQLFGSIELITDNGTEFDIAFKR